MVDSPSEEVPVVILAEEALGVILIEEVLVAVLTEEVIAVGLAEEVHVVLPWLDVFAGSSWQRPASLQASLKESVPKFNNVK